MDYEIWKKENLSDQLTELAVQLEENRRWDWLPSIWLNQFDGAITEIVITERGKGFRGHRGDE